MLAYPTPAAPPAPGSNEAALHAIIDDARITMEGEMLAIRERCLTYLNWYSPPFDPFLQRHDAWEEDVDPEADAETTRNNFPIARACVDIWTSLEAAHPPIPRADPERVMPPPPVLDAGEARIFAEMYRLRRTNESRKADIRSSNVRRWMRRDQFALKHHTAVRRKNLYGFSWMRVLPDQFKRQPKSHVLRNPTTVYPLWSRRDPGELEAVLAVEQESAVRADARWGLGLQFQQAESGRLAVAFDRGADSGIYRDLNDRWYDASRTMVWVEEFWWIERTYGDERDRERQTGSKVHKIVRVCGRVVEYRSYDWTYLPWIYWENVDERDSYGWSEVAGVIDINDEFNRRLSEEGDILHLYSHPRFMLTGSFPGRDVEIPGPLELVTLNDTERIEQILTRIDVYPQQVHVQALTDLLHRVTGLPPIVWGLIANAQTSGRALTASWKATETRLAPKLMRNQQSLDRWLDICIDYARRYDWDGGSIVFADREGQLFADWRWTFPPMEPRDFQEVTMNAITKRDAGLSTTVQAMRETGDEDAESTWEEVQAEFGNINAHPDKVQARFLADRAQLDNIAFAQQLGQQVQGPTTPATVGQAVGAAREAQAAGPAAAPPGAEGGLPPTAPGAAGNAGQPSPSPGGAPSAPGEMVTTGTLVRGGDVSNQVLQTRRL